MRPRTGSSLSRSLSLSTRLVALTVLLVALTAALIGTAITLAMRSHLTGELDDGVRESLARSFGGDPDRPDRPGGPRGFGAGQRFGSLAAAFPDGSDPTDTAGSDGQGSVLSQRHDRGSQSTTLSAEQLAVLARVPADGDPRTVHLPDLGGYRVVAQQATGGVAVAGLPTRELDETVGNLIRLELLATLLGVLAAAGAGLVLVRRQLAPLREVADTAHRVAERPLASGEIELTDRVPARLSDTGTEVGQVGAALNTLLDHVEASLAARHRSEQQVRQFVADASHELRTPLATIAGYAELARRRPGDTDANRASWDRVESASARMAALVEDLLLLARLDAGRPLAADTVDLSRLAVEAVSDARVLAPAHGWRLDLPTDAVLVRGDEQRLHQVLSNLLTNARLHTPPGTGVTVRVRPGELVVTDDGPGVPAEIAGRAFERFVRGEESRARAESDGPTSSGTASSGPASSGTGLGLSLVEAIVHAHGGTVTMSSRPGETRVTVRLPDA